jgi:hypothetical protein
MTNKFNNSNAEAIEQAWQEWTKTLGQRFWDEPAPLTIPFNAGYQAGYLAALKKTED